MNRTDIARRAKVLAHEQTTACRETHGSVAGDRHGRQCQRLADQIGEAMVAAEAGSAEPTSDNARRYAHAATPACRRRDARSTPGHTSSCDHLTQVFHTAMQEALSNG